MWRLNPFFGQVWQRYRNALNPFCWSKRTVRIVTATLLLIILPLYVLVGADSVSSIEYKQFPKLEIPQLELTTPVAELQLQDRQLVAPATIAGSYSQTQTKTLIIGHSSTVFQDLNQMSEQSYFYYNQKTYRVQSIEIIKKDEISMNQILAPAIEETVIIMTCAGEPLPNQDATHRLIITAVLAEKNLANAI